MMDIAVSQVSLKVSKKALGNCIGKKIYIASIKIPKKMAM